MPNLPAQPLHSSQPLVVFMPNYAKSPPGLPGSPRLPGSPARCAVAGLAPAAPVNNGDSGMNPEIDDREVF